MSRSHLLCTQSSRHPCSSSSSRFRRPIEISQLQYIDNVVDVLDVQVYMFHTVVEMSEIPTVQKTKTPRVWASHLFASWHRRRLWRCVEIGACPPAESASFMFVTTPVFEEPKLHLEFHQCDFTGCQRAPRRLSSCAETLDHGAACDWIALICMKNVDHDALWLADEITQLHFIENIVVIPEFLTVHGAPVRLWHKRKMWRSGDQTASSRIVTPHVRHGTCLGGSSSCCGACTTRSRLESSAWKMSTTLRCGGLR